MTVRLVHMCHPCTSGVVHLLGTGIPVRGHLMNTAAVCYLTWDPFLSLWSRAPVPGSVWLLSCPSTAQGPLVLGQLLATCGHADEQNQGHTWAAETPWLSLVP